MRLLGASNATEMRNLLVRISLLRYTKYTFTWNLYALFIVPNGILCRAAGQNILEMYPTIPENPPAIAMSPYDRRKDLEDFDNSKAGVKCLVDSGIKKVPRIFIRPAEDIAAEDKQEPDTGFEIPVIDLGEVGGPGRSDSVSGVERGVRGGFLPGGEPCDREGIAGADVGGRSGFP